MPSANPAAASGWPAWAELLRGRDGEWRIHSLWRDQAAPVAVRAGPEPPAAPTLFRQLDEEPVLRVYALQATHREGFMDG